MTISKGKQALIDVALWLEAGAPHKGDVDGFDLSVGVAMRDPACGTVCCIAGALVQFNEPVTEKLKSQMEYDDDDHEYNWGTVFRRGMAIAELTEEQAEALFEPDVWDRSEVTPAEAARVIRHFVETGEVDWGVANEE
jgi:hypothetical protein